MKSEIKYENRFRISNGFYKSVMLYNPITKKNTRYAINPAVASKKDAEKIKRQLELQLGILQAKSKKRFEFLQKFNNQEKLFEAFKEYRAKNNPRSFNQDVSWMKNYVFPFFIGKLNLNHPSMWFEHWQEFHEEIKIPIRRNTKGRELSTNSKDNIVRAANAFICFVEQKEMGSPIKRIPQFKNEEKGARGIESLYTESEINSVVREFRSRGHVVYGDLFYIISNTGQRVGEAMGLFDLDVIIGVVPKQEKWIFYTLKDKTEIFGYILLKSQPFNLNHMIIDGVAKRYPLKGRKKIAAEYNRIIPIISLETAKLFQKYKRSVRASGLLFEGCGYSEFYSIFNEIKAGLNLPRERDFHSLRHTFATRFVRLCDGDPRIAEKVLGHSDAKLTQRYNHLAEELEALNQHRSLSSIEFEIEPIKI